MKCKVTVDEWYPCSKYVKVGDMVIKNNIGVIEPFFTQGDYPNYFGIVTEIKEEAING